MKKKKRNLARKILPILLTALVVCTALPVGTFAEQIHDLNFHSKRLLVGTDDPGIFADPSVVISSYRNTYLLQFPDEETARTAYAYYLERADFIEVDTGIEAAQPEEALPVKEDAPVVTETFMTEDENPFKELQTQLEEDRAAEEMALANGEEPQQPVYDIALIDTGVPADAGADAISLIGEDPADDNGHGSGMLARIREQNPEANVLSIKALDKDGKGDISAVYAGIEYAIEKNVRIINLSMSAAAAPDNCILEQAVALAKEKGIPVVGAAGNNGKDAGYYIPGSIADAWVIGACDEKGSRLANSNYGETVDLNIAAGSTSDAAALFSGWLSVYGEDGIPSALGQGLLFPADAAEEPADREAPEKEDAGFQAAYPVSGEGVIKLSGYDIYIDPDKTILNNPEMSFTSTLSPGLGSFEVKTATWDSVYAPGTYDSALSVVFHAPASYSKGRIYRTEDPDPNKSCFTLRWPKAAFDASGKAYDVILDCSAINLEIFADQEPGRDYLIMISRSGTMLSWETYPLVGMVQKMQGLSTEYTIKVCEHGTDRTAPGTFYFAAQDIDRPDQLAWWKETNGQYWTKDPLGFFEQSPGQPYLYAETTRFDSAPASPIYVEHDTMIKSVGGAGQLFYGTQVNDDIDSFQAGFVCAAPCGGIRLGWSGSNCGTRIFNGLPANTCKIKAWVVDDMGGQITKEGYTYYYAGQDSNYQMTPDPNWEIEYVKVDGEKIRAADTYDFNNIQADHTICVKYRRITGDLKLTNEVPKGTLKVAKNTAGTGADTSKAFTFTATTLGNAGTYKKYSSNGTQVTSGAGSGAGTALMQGGTFTLSGGQYILLSLPAGTQYVITESADDDYRTGGSPVSGTIKANRDFTYTVNLKDGDENVSGLSIPYTGSKEGTLTTDSSGNAEITLSGGQNVTLENIPIAFTYTVTQTAVSGFDTTPANRTVSGSKTTEEQAAAFTNTPSQAAATVTNTYHGLGSHYNLTVEKAVTGNMGNRAKEFHFHMTLSKPEANLNDAGITYKKTLQDGTIKTGSVTLTDGAYDFVLTHGEKIVFTGIPDKTTYEVTEAEANKEQYVTTVSGGASGGLTANTSAKFTNRRQMAVPTRARILTIGSVAFMFALLASSSFYIVFSLKKKKKENR